eukprot:7200505-Pyramimonas_sp.AAC.1
MGEEELGGQRPLVRQQALDQTSKQRLPIWSSPRRQEEADPLSWTVNGDLAPITVDDALGAAASFSPSTASGWDSFSPRLLLQLLRPL